MRVLRPSSLHEVVFHFLCNQFHKGDFAWIDSATRQLICAPDFSTETCELRRQLLFASVHKHWRELPCDTAWAQVVLEAEDQRRLRAFPRGQWRAISRKRYPLISDVSDALQKHEYPPEHAEHAGTIENMCASLKSGRAGADTFAKTAIVMVCRSDKSPLIVLEGNHRLVAAILSGLQLPDMPFTLFCGLSAAMYRYWIYNDNPISYFLHARVTLRERLTTQPRSWTRETKPQGTVA